MDYNLLFIIISFLFIFGVVIYQAIKNKIDFRDNLHEVVSYSFSNTMKFVLATALIIYSTFDKMIYDLSDIYLHFGSFALGFLWLMEVIINLHNKYEPKKNKNTEDGIS